MISCPSRLVNDQEIRGESYCVVLHLRHFQLAIDALSFRSEIFYPAGPTSAGLRRTWQRNWTDELKRLYVR